MREWVEHPYRLQPARPANPYAAELTDEVLAQERCDLFSAALAREIAEAKAAREEPES